MIPKIIHYCWFGGSVMPAEYEQYIKEWYELHPDWEIIKWDESNFPADNEYIITALKEGNWANASNYARFHVLKDYGGIYLDVDVKLIKSLDRLLSNSFFIGFESFVDKNDFWINSAVMGATTGSRLVVKAADQLIKNFNGKEEADQSGPKLITALLKEEFPDISEAKYCNSEVFIYPPETFYPVLFNERYKLEDIDSYISEKTFAIHVWGRTWFTIDKCLHIIDQLEHKVKQLEEEKVITECDKVMQNHALLDDRQNILDYLTKQVNILKEENLLQAEISFIENIYMRKLEEKDVIINKLSVQINSLIDTNQKLCEILYNRDIRTV